MLTDMKDSFLYSTWVELLLDNLLHVCANVDFVFVENFDAVVNGFSFLELSHVDLPVIVLFEVEDVLIARQVHDTLRFQVGLDPTGR